MRSVKMEIPDTGGTARVYTMCPSEHLMTSSLARSTANLLSACTTGIILAYPNYE